MTERQQEDLGIELLTQDEAVKVLRLDSVGLSQPKEALRHLRRTRQIGYLKVAGKVLIPRSEIESYLARQRVEPSSGDAWTPSHLTSGSVPGPIKYRRRGDPEPRKGGKR